MTHPTDSDAPRQWSAAESGSKQTHTPSPPSGPWTPGRAYAPISAGALEPQLTPPPYPGNPKIPRATRRKYGLAYLLREYFPDEIVCRWFLTALGGHCPLLVEDARYESGLRIDKGAPLDSAQIDKVFDRMLHRRDGAPAQHVVLDAEVKGTIANLHAAIDPGVVRGALDAGVDAVALMRALQTALEPRREPAELPVLDASSTELKSGED